MKILVTNIYSYNNKGDAAIVIALVSEIRRVFPRATIKLHTTDIQNDKDKYGEPAAGSLMWILFSSIRDASLPKKLFETFARTTGLIIYLFFANIFKWRAPWLLRGEVKSYVNDVSDADMVIACGGGYLCTADSSPKSLLLLFGMCLSFLSGHYIGKPVYLYSQSVGPVHDWFARWMVKFSLKRVDFIAVREDISMGFVQELNIQTPFIRTADPVFLLKGQQKPNPIKLPPAPLQVGVTVRKWFSTEEQLDNYVGIIAQLIDFLVTTYQARVTYIPQVVASDFGDDDRLVAKKLESLVQNKKSFNLLTDNLHPLELIDLCSKMDIFVGTRMHSNIFSLLNDVPVVAIKYEHKTQGIMDGLGIGDTTVDIETITFDELRSKVEMVLGDRKKYSGLIEKNMPRQIKLSRSAMELIENSYEYRLSNANGKS